MKKISSKKSDLIHEFIRLAIELLRFANAVITLVNTVFNYSFLYVCEVECKI